MGHGVLPVVKNGGERMDDDLSKLLSSVTTVFPEAALGEINGEIVIYTGVSWDGENLKPIDDP